MKWEKWDQLTKKQKEEYKYRFDRYTITGADYTLPAAYLIVGAIFVTGGIITKNKILLELSSISAYIYLWTIAFFFTLSIYAVVKKILWVRRQNNVR